MNKIKGLIVLLVLVSVLAITLAVDCIKLRDIIDNKDMQLKAANTFIESKQQEIDRLQDTNNSLVLEIEVYKAAYNKACNTIAEMTGNKSGRIEFE